MSSSSTASGRKSSIGKNNDGERYYCGEEPWYGISGTPNNPGRRFRNCPNSNPNPNGPKTGCKYFRWLEPPRAKEEVEKIIGGKELQMMVFLLKLVLVMMVAIALLVTYVIVILNNKNVYLALP